MNLGAGLRPMTRILSSGFSLPPRAPSALLTFLKASLWIPDSPDSVFIHSVLRESAVMQGRQGGGNDCGGEGGDHSGRNVVGNGLFA